jgi:hypothetical protein
LNQIPALLGHGEYDLPAVGRVGRPADQPSFLENRYDPRHRRRLDLLMLRQLARRHRVVPLEGRQRGELDVGQDGLGPAETQTLHAQPSRQSGDRNPHRGRQTRICLHTRLRHPPSTPCVAASHIHQSAPSPATSSIGSEIETIAGHQPIPDIPDAV